MKRSQLPLTLNLKLFSGKSSNTICVCTKNHLHTSISNNFAQIKDPTAIASVLTHSSNLKSLVLGSQTHAQILKLGFINDIFSQNNLIVMYSKCCDLGSGLKVFDEMTERNLVTWTSIISGCIQNGEYEMGLNSYVNMIISGFRPNEFSFGSVLKGCTSLDDIRFGSYVHCLSLKIGLVNNHFVVSSILYMYAKCGFIEAAERLFQCLNDRDVGCWNAMIEGYAINGYSFQALQLLSLMKKEGVIMDQFTFMSAIKGCSILCDLNLGRQIHGMVTRSQVKFSSSGMNTLVDMYFKIGKKDYALKSFNNIQDKDVISWNTVISEFAQDEKSGKAVTLFSEMLETGTNPNHITFSILFKLCGVLVDLSLGFQFYSLAYHLGFINEPILANSLINMFSKCCRLDLANSVFISLSNKAITSWNEMISGYSLNGCTEESLEIFANLWESGVKPDEFTFSSILGACSGTENLQMSKQIHGAIIKSGFGFQGFVCSSLINTYGRFGLVDDCFLIFKEIERLDLASWGAIISAFVRGSHVYEALELLNYLIEDGKKPDEFILGSILNGCANIAAYKLTKSIHCLLVKIGFENHAFVSSSVIDAYAKCGDIGYSRMAFDRSSRYDDAVLLNTMIMAYAHHGLVMEANEIFNKMKSANLTPNHSTFVSVISMCSHMGLVEEGCRFFHSISLVYRMVPSAENYGCLVDLFSRNGFLEKAKNVIETMPFVPWPAVWRSFLNGCRIHGNRELGEWASKELVRLVPDNDAAYVLLSKVYSEEGRWEEVAGVRKTMTKRGVKKETGFSRIEL